MTEPTCHFCGNSDKSRCKTREQANGCSFFTPPEDEIDFGFSFADDEEAKAVEAIQLAVASTDEVERLTKINKDLDRRVQKLYNAILPFLDNLCANPQQPNIRWPNRVEKIQEFKAKLAAIAQGKKK
jgi:hypothetical protein